MGLGGCRFATGSSIAMPTRILVGGDGAFEVEDIRGTGTSVLDKFGAFTTVGGSGFEV